MEQASHNEQEELELGKSNIIGAAHVRKNKLVSQDKIGILCGW
jgi:hypothetical protein